MTRHSMALMLEGLRRAAADLAEQTRATFEPKRKWCTLCDGEGYLWDDAATAKCPRCDGTGRILPDTSAEEEAASREMPEYYRAPESAATRRADDQDDIEAADLMWRDAPDNDEGFGPDDLDEVD